MGMTLSSTVGYGFLIKYPIEGGDDDDELFNILSELQNIDFGEDNECYEDYMLYEELYNLTWNSGNKSEVVLETFGTPSDYEFYAVLVAESVQSSGWEPQAVEVTALETKPEWNNILKNFCNKTGLTYKKPGWVFGPYYSY